MERLSCCHCITVSSLSVCQSSCIKTLVLLSFCFYIYILKDLTHSLHLECKKQITSSPQVIVVLINGEPPKSCCCQQKQCHLQLIHLLSILFSLTVCEHKSPWIIFLTNKRTNKKSQPINTTVPVGISSLQQLGHRFVCRVITQKS